MRDFDEHTITEAVVKSFQSTPDPRLQQLLSSLTRHLHAYVKEVEPTIEEWDYAIDYLTRTGQICDDKRQEYILLSDVLGVSMLVDSINHRMPEGVTETTVLGPFFVADAPEMKSGANITNGMEGQPLYVMGRVIAPTGEPLADALVDVWQSDGDGYYDVQMADRDDAALRARFRTDKEGRFSFWSVVPSDYPIPDDGPVGEMLAATKRHPYRPAHVHFMIAKEGFEGLTTHIFSSESPYLDADTVFGVKESLIADLTHEEPGIAPDGSQVDEEWRKLVYDFMLKPTNSAAKPNSLSPVKAKD